MDSKLSSGPSFNYAVLGGCLGNAPKALSGAEYPLCFGVLALMLEHGGMLRQDTLAELLKMLFPLGIAGGGQSGFLQGILGCAQVRRRTVVLSKLLIGCCAMPIRRRPLQAIGFDRAYRQQSDLTVEDLQRLLRFMRGGQQRYPIFVVGHDTGHVFGGRGSLRPIQLRLARLYGFCILRLQKPGAILRNRRLTTGRGYGLS